MLPAGTDSPSRTHRAVPACADFRGDARGAASSEERRLNRLPYWCRQYRATSNRACAQARHLAQCATAHVLQFRRIAHFFLKQRAQSRGHKLRQMADPRHQLIVTRGVEIDGLGAHGDNPLPPVFAQRRRQRRALPRGIVGKQPHRAAKQIRISQAAPPRSLPAMGCPGRNAARSGVLKRRPAASVICALVLPTSVTRCSGPSTPDNCLHQVERCIDGHGEAAPPGSRAPLCSGSAATESIAPIDSASLAPAPGSDSSL